MQLIPNQHNKNLVNTQKTLMEFHSPSAALISSPVPLAARGTLWMVVMMVITFFALSALVPVDKVVTATGRIISSSPNIVVQPLDTAIVREINVREGQTVKAGQTLAKLDSTFASADLTSLENSAEHLKAYVERLQAENNNKEYTPTTTNPASTLQRSIFEQHTAQYKARLENYKQKINGFRLQITKSTQEAAFFKERSNVAQDIEGMRGQLERMQVGSKLNSLASKDARLEASRALTSALANAETAKHDLQAMEAERDAYIQEWKAKISQELSEQTNNLNEIYQKIEKARLHRQLVELKSPQDAIVLNVAKVSVGSVLQSGDQFFTLVPANSPLEVEVRLDGRDAGFVQKNNNVTIKFDTFPFAKYGAASGKVYWISADSFTEDPSTPVRGHRMEGPSAPGSFFKARITLDEIKLHDTPEDFQITSGMPVTADIKVGTRTILSYLLGRVLPVVMDGMREP